MSDSASVFATIRQALLSGDEIALLDVREEGPFAEAHPLFAASFPLGRLELEIFDRIPRLETRLVLFDSGEELAPRAETRLRALGYRHVEIFPGGIQGWAAVGGELFRDVNVPSKAFGELVEAHRHTPSLSAREVHALIEQGANIAILDARRREEYETMSIPTATSVPGGELVLRVGALAPDSSTLVIVNCAGRTRSIIGTQSLVNAGIPNRVAALRNGTIGWTLEGLALDHGARRVAPAVDHEKASTARHRARTVARRAGVRHIDRQTVEQWRAEPGRTTYLFDVRSPAEYVAGHLPGFRPAAGGQLVQEADVFAPVRGARIVLWDGEGVRADMTASWLAQMGWDVAVLDGVEAADATARGPAPLNRPAPESWTTITVDAARELIGGNGVRVVDVAPSPEYVKGHIPGAWLLSRTHLDVAAQALPAASTIVVTSTDSALARFAAPELSRTLQVTTMVLAGGTAAWRDAGLELRSGPEHFTAAPIDVYKRPYEGTDNAAEAMQGYLDWEYGLVGQLARDGTHRFSVLE